MSEHPQLAIIGGSGLYTIPRLEGIRQAGHERVLLPQAQAHVCSSGRGRQVPAPLHERHVPTHQGFRESAHTLRINRSTRGLAYGPTADQTERDHHFPALPRPHRLSRATSLRIRASRPCRSPSRGDRSSITWHGSIRARGVSGLDGRRPSQRVRTDGPRSAGGHRGQ